MIFISPLSFCSGGHNPGVLQQPADQVLRAPDPGERDQDALESPAPEPVRGHQEVHCRTDHKDQLGAGESREGEDLSQQTQHDPGSGKNKKKIQIIIAASI